MSFWETCLILFLGICFILPSILGTILLLTEITLHIFGIPHTHFQGWVYTPN